MSVDPMTVSEIYNHCTIFRDNTTGQQPAGPDAPPTFRKMSERMDMGSIQEIMKLSPSAPGQSGYGDLEITNRISIIQKLGRSVLLSYPAGFEQLCSQVDELREYLFKNYTI